MYEDNMFLITFIASDFVFKTLAGNDEENLKRHALALEKFQRTRDKWNKRKAQKVKK